MRSSFVLFAVLCLTSTMAECPNGCSGQGTCSARDMCQCHKNYQGNDCSERTCPHAYSFIDTPKGELNMDGSIKSTWELTNSQQWPAGGYEFLNPDAQVQEGHFYMECANKGVCDRETGKCDCFNGYTGHACQRTVCPNDCNGHGTCESIGELASKRGGSLFFKDSYHGDQSYDLWDSKSTYGCKCDPWYYGADCSSRRCKVGIDPMYEAAGREIVETIVFAFGINNANQEYFHSDSYVRLRFFDYWGEAYETTRITIGNNGDVGVSNTATATALQTALKALPNRVVTDVTCSDQLDATVTNYKVASFPATTFGLTIYCHFSANPGTLRLPELSVTNLVATINGNDVTALTGPIARITGTSQRGENTDVTGSSVGTVTDIIIGDTTMTVTFGTLTDMNYGASNQAILMKLLNHYVAVVNIASGTDYTLQYAYSGETISGGTTPLFHQPSALVIEGDTSGRVASWALGATSFTAAGSPTYAVGATLFFENQWFNVVSIAGTTIGTDRPFAGKATDATAIGEVTDLLYWTSVPTTNTFTYVSECSGRGLCNMEAGVCQCFKGYTSDNCDTQNILSF